MHVNLYIIGSVILISLVSFAGLFSISINQRLLKKTLAFFIPLAVGALLGDAFFHLIPESFEEGTNYPKISLLIISGILSFFFLEKVLRHHHHSREKIQAEGEESKHLGQIILISDGFHNFIDGIIIGVSYLAGIEIGIATTLAVILHEVPQELGDFGVLIHSGYKRSTALLYNFLSAATSVGGALLVILLGSFPESLIESVIPFAAGIFIYIASSDLVPELHRSGKGKNTIPQIAGLFIGLLTMYLLLFLE
jgi:zinc and cadmium transporter